MKNKKVIVLGTLGTVALVAATVVPIVWMNKNKETTKEEDIAVYADKLKALEIKEIRIEAVSGTITENKKAIIAKLKDLNGFPKLPTGITLDVKDDSSILTLKGNSILLIVKKQGETNVEIKGFSVSRSATNQEAVDIYKSVLLLISALQQATNINFKTLKINTTSGTITDNKVKILEALKEKGKNFEDGNVFDNSLLSESGLSLSVKDDDTMLSTTNKIPITIEINKGQAKSLIDGSFGSFRFVVIRSFTLLENTTNIKNYFKRWDNRKIFIPNETSISSAEDILTFIKNKIGNNLTNEQKALITSKSGQPTSLIKGQTTNIIFLINQVENVTLSVTHRTVDAQAIFDYFEILNNIVLFISESKTISNNSELSTVIQDSLEILDSSTFDSTSKTYVTVASDYVYSPFTKGIGKSVKVKIQKGSETQEFKTILVTHRTVDAQEIFDYFDKELNSLSIPNSTAISSKNELNIAIQNALEMLNPSIFDSTSKTYVTVASDYVYSPFIKGIAKNVKVKIQKDSETQEFKTFPVTHLTS